MHDYNNLVKPPGQYWKPLHMLTHMGTFPAMGWETGRQRYYHHLLNTRKCIIKMLMGTLSTVHWQPPPSNAGGEGSVPGLGTKIPYGPQPKTKI